MKSLVATLQPLQDPSALQFIGITTMPRNECLPEDICPEHPMVAMENELCSHMGTFAMNLIISRFKKFMHMVRGWPANSVRWTADSEPVRNVGCNMLAGYYKALLYVKSQKSKECKDLADRSIFNIVPVQQAAGIMKETNWKATTKVKQLYTKKHNRVLASQITEDGVQRQRRLEDLRRNRRGTPAVAFKTLIATNKLPTYHIILQSWRCLS